MATIAQVAAQRRRQVSVVRAAYRAADTAGEVLERKLRTYSSKKRMLEAKDMAPLNQLYRDYTNKVAAVEKELTNLNNLTNA